jgi:esterase
MAVALAATEYGEGKPAAILHGLFGSARNWASIAQRLGARHRVIVFDLRNHGASPWADAMDYPAMAEDLRAAMAARGHRRFAVIGHSMGGKVAMTLALSEPAAVERLVVVDIGPTAAPAPFLGHIRAMRALDLAKVARRRDADAALAAAIPDPATRAFLLQGLVFGDGAPRWQLNLAALEAALPAIGGFPEFPSGTHYDGPALFIAGGKSDLLPRDSEPAIRAFFPHAAIERIANAGHWVHAEQPAAFLTLVEPFLVADAD